MYFEILIIELDFFIFIMDSDPIDFLEYFTK